jgi:hypothetical protein
MYMDNHDDQQDLFQRLFVNGNRMIRLGMTSFDLDVSVAINAIVFLKKEKGKLIRNSI